MTPLQRLHRRMIMLDGFEAKLNPKQLNPEQASRLAAYLEAMERFAASLPADHLVDGDAQLDTALPAPPPKQLSVTQRRLIEAAGREEDGELLFQHTVLCQTSMPYRDPGDDVREWARVNGTVHLEIIAGKAMHPELERFVPIGLPFGPKPRLVLMHLNAEAVRTGSPVIEVEGSLRSFVKRLKLDPKGRNIGTIKDQLGRLSASSIRLGTVKDGRAVTVNSQVITAFDLWFPRDDRQRVLWPTTIRLSSEYFESLLTSAVPLSEPAIRGLSHSAMALDVYSWLAQRLHRIDPAKPQFIPWTALKGQFGDGYGRIRDFRAVFLRTLRQVNAVYPDAKIVEELGSSGRPRGLMLKFSPSPIPKLMISV